MKIFNFQSVLVVLGLIAIVGVALWLPLSKPRILSEPAVLADIVRANQKLPNGTLVIPPEGVRLADGTVLDQIVSIGRYGDIIIDDGGDNAYQIVWLPRSEKFVVFIQREPYEKNLKRAEKRFLDILGRGSTERACGYQVFVQQAPWLAEDAPKSLSFC